MDAFENRGELVDRPNRIAILDAGSQYGGLIDRNIRESGFRTELLPLETPAAKLAEYSAVIVSGGPASVNEEGAPDCDPALFDMDKPVLGICYGMQLMAKHLGGRVEATDLREDGPQETLFFGASKLFQGLEGKSQKVLMSHGDSVVSAPPGCRIVGGLDNMISAIDCPDKSLYGVQFHPEVFQTECGSTLFDNFLHDVAELEPDYTIEDQKREAIDYIRERVGDKDVVLFLSGGVDSTVLAALMAQAIDDKEKIHAYHIDTGFMRKGESALVMDSLAEAGIDVTLLDEANGFYKATTLVDGVETPPLCEVTDPQLKRKIIGDTFIRVRSDIIKQLGLGEDSVLAQGSLRPDLIESGSHMASSRAATIKTHHNDTDEVRKLRALNRVIEPLQAMYKDQVRQLGRKLGLPEAIVDRHPFPGPGLAIRILCEAGVTLSPVEVTAQADSQAELNKLLHDEGFTEFTATVLPVKSVGVQGDSRSYKPCVSVSGPADWHRLSELASLVPNRVHGVNRVCYAFDQQAPDVTLSLTRTVLEEDSGTISQIREADHIATELLLDAGVIRDISQMPVVSLPVSFGERGERSIVLRPFISPDFMTGIAAIPGNHLPENLVFEMARRIKSEVPGISQVLYDLSNKPPGTTEWE